jgi:hypothetical protein
VFDQGCHVVGHRLEGHGPFDVGGAAVGLEVHAYDLPVSSEQRQYLAEHLDRADTAVKQDQGLPFAVNLIVHLEAVHRGVVPPGLAVRSIRHACAFSAGS